MCPRPPTAGPALVNWSAAYARELLAALPNRWEHSAGVAGLAGHVAKDIGIASFELVAAAYLHDIGYSPELEDVGFHPLDGARHLDSLGLPDIVVRLVAHHTTADVEAQERSLEGQLARFPLPPDALADVLLYCDLHTGPAGERVSLAARLDDIYRRYDAVSPVRKALDRSRAHLKSVDQRVEALRDQG